MIILLSLLLVQSMSPEHFDSNSRLTNYIETFVDVKCGYLTLESIETLESVPSWELLRVNFISYNGFDYYWDFIQTSSHITRLGAMGSGLDSYAIVGPGDSDYLSIICTYTAGSGTYYSFIDWYSFHGNKISRTRLPFCYDEGECVIVNGETNIFYILDLRTKIWIGELEFQPQTKEWFFKINKDLKEEISMKVKWDD